MLNAQPNISGGSGPANHSECVSSVEMLAKAQFSIQLQRAVVFRDAETDLGNGLL